MGQVDARLARLFETVRADVALPVIVSTRRPPDAAILQAAALAGAGPVRVVSQLGSVYATTATAQVAAKLAALPDTASVYYDEPVAALPR